jgi:hypothetical protein
MVTYDVDLVLSADPRPTSLMIEAQSPIEAINTAYDTIRELRDRQAFGFNGSVQIKAVWDCKAKTVVYLNPRL